MSLSSVNGAFHSLIILVLSLSNRALFYQCMVQSAIPSQTPSVSTDLSLSLIAVGFQTLWQRKRHDYIEGNERKKTLICTCLSKQKLTLLWWWWWRLLPLRVFLPYFFHHFKGVCDQSTFDRHG